MDLKKLRNLGLSVLTAFSLFSSGFLSSCNQNTPNVGSGDDTPTYTCSSLSSEDYSDLNLSVDLTKYDKSEGCFTVEEENFFNSLEYLKQNNLSTTQELEEIVESFPTIGRATVNAFNWSIIGYLNDKIENPTLGNFTYRFIGIFPIFDNKNVNEIIVNGKTIKKPVLLPGWGLPNRYADPNINPNIIIAVPYSPYIETEIPGIMDWANETSDIVNFLTLMGCSECKISENVRGTSYDLNKYRSFHLENGNIIYDEGPITPLQSIVPDKAIVHIVQDNTFRDRSDNGIVPHITYNVILQYKVDPRDYPLWGVDVSVYKNNPLEFYFYYTHVIPDFYNPFADISSFPFSEGEVVFPGDFIGYMDNKLGSYYALDFNIFELFPGYLGPLFGFPSFPKNLVYTGYLVDLFSGVLYSKGVIVPQSKYPGGFSFIKPTNPRALTVEIFRPSVYNPSTNTYFNKP